MSAPLNYDGKEMPVRINADYIQAGVGTYGLAGTGVCWYVREDIYTGRIERMSGDGIKAMITELSQYLTQSEIESLVIGDGAISWTEEEPK
jgi:hypothetical protein